VLNYRRAASPLYRRLTGQAPKGVPVVCTFVVAAVDDQLQQATTKVVALIDLPQDEVIKAAPAPLPVAAGNPTSQPAELDARVRQLENEVRILQGKVDLLTQLLQNRK